ncbi:hypothetical protein HHL19_31220 [Streptomyces sp. R302]|uniref:hypothetical protein n=1 Tax=unclassified Streptomyces TaxID=2593676 RepID=UPI00145F3641|nr:MULTISPECIES: hypothetical protein [unclassified Streptomyces]NML53751.1 hypothetical protein [Streptomyces sp. R301]NML83010.1 hypothetical protein [Streptomyces sp. R302]
MWPGQQPPGGEQNPQDQNQNPYQQPGYQQPNPYQQPTQPGFPQQGGYPQYPQQGYAQPNPYQQPTVPQYQVPGPVPPQGPGGGGRKRTTLIAIVAATAVVVAGGVTAFLVLGEDEGGKDVAEKPAASSSAPSSPATASSEPPEAPTSEIENPRGAGEEYQPTIPGWKVVHNPSYGTLFDVPPEWEVGKPTMRVGFEDTKKGDGSPLVVMSGPADLKSKWCAFDSDKNGSPEYSGLAGAGTKGAQGAKDAASAARGQAGMWVWAAFAQHMPEKTIKISTPVPYTTESGLKGSMATAVAPGVTKRNKCETDGKSMAFSFLNAKNDLSTFVLYAADGVKDELPDATMRKILSTVRLTPSS